MRVHLSISVSMVVALGGSSAHAEHEHGAPRRESAFGAGLAVVAASFETMLYVGNYQGVLPTVSWANDRVAVIASGAFYRLEENGATFWGLGDVHAHAQVSVVDMGPVQTGVVAGVSAPVGDSRRGFGMGHVMVMPAAFAAWTAGRVSTSATAGYSRAIGGDADHDHGMWPLVEPMNVSELTWSAGSEVAIVQSVRVGARVSGGIPLGGGDNRIVAAVRAAWRTGRVDTAAELQAGLAGDPFTLRGVVSTALSF